MSDEDPHLIALKVEFDRLLAKARGDGHDLADIVTTVAAALGEACGALTTDGFNAARNTFIRVAWRHYYIEHRRLEEAAKTVYAAGSARRPRGRR
jgi:hypothetical protein